MTSIFEGICGKVAPGLCRLSMNGTIAVKTTSGYRTYDSTNGRLINCDSFVLDIGEDYFFVVPATKVEAGDIILASGKPKCVVKAENETITAINYEDMVVETLLPEHHMFMGNTYMFGKIVSIFGKSGVNGQKGMNRMMKYMMLSSMMKGKDGAAAMLPFMMMNGNNDFMDGLFDEAEEA